MFLFKCCIEIYYKDVTLNIINGCKYCSIFCNKYIYCRKTNIYVFILLYSKKSTNLYSLTFSLLNLWITYSQMILDMILDMPLLVRGSSDLLLFSISSSYIIYNRMHINTENEFSLTKPN